MVSSLSGVEALLGANLATSSTLSPSLQTTQGLTSSESFAASTVDILSQSLLGTQDTNLNGLQSGSLLNLESFIQTQIADPADQAALQTQLEGLSQLLNTINSLNSANVDPVFSLLAGDTSGSFDSIDLLV